MNKWYIYYNGRKIDTVYYDLNSADDVKYALINHDMWCNGKGQYQPYPVDIVVRLA